MLYADSAEHAHDDARNVGSDPATLNSIFSNYIIVDMVVYVWYGSAAVRPWLSYM